MLAYLNNEAGIDIIEFQLEVKNKFWRSPTELFTNTKQQLAYLLVTKAGDSTAEIKEVPDVESTVLWKFSHSRSISII